MQAYQPPAEFSVPLPALPPANSGHAGQSPLQLASGLASAAAQSAAQGAANVAAQGAANVAAQGAANVAGNGAANGTVNGTVNGAVNVAVNVDVAVVGASVAGLFIAQALGRRGYRCALIGPELSYERTADGFDSRIFALSPASWTWIEDQGLGALIDNSRLASITRMQLYPQSWAEGARAKPSEGAWRSESPRSAHRVRPEWPMLEFDAAREMLVQLAQTVEQSELIHAGRQALAFSGVTRIAASLEQLEQPDPLRRRRRLILSDGRRVSARLVLGCDGAQSALRRLAGFREHRHDFGARAVVANFACEYPHRSIASQWFTEEGIVALLPLPGYRVSLVWSAPSEVAAALVACDPEDLVARVEERCQTRTGPCALGRLRPLGEAASFELFDLQVDSPVGDRIVLLADAAHVVHPMAGQGLNLGLGDVAVLNDLLASRAARHDPGEALLLARYRRARREAVQSVALLTRGLNRLMQTSLNPGVEGLTRWAWSGLAKSAVLKSFFVARATGHGPYTFSHPSGGRP